MKSLRLKKLILNRYTVKYIRCGRALGSPGLPQKSSAYDNSVDIKLKFVVGKKGANFVVGKKGANFVVGGKGANFVGDAALCRPRKS